MPWWLDLVLLMVSVILWSRGTTNRDDTFGLLEKILAVAALLVVLLGGRWLVLELAALALTFFMPNAGRFEPSERP